MSRGRRYRAHHPLTGTASRPTRGPWWRPGTRPRTSAGPRRCSPWPTATSGCAATRRRVVEAVEQGTYINGFHETWPIRHAEAAFGFARTGQTIVNAPDAKVIKLYVDDEPLMLGTSEIEHYERVPRLRHRPPAPRAGVAHPVRHAGEGRVHAGWCR